MKDLNQTSPSQALPTMSVNKYSFKNMYSFSHWDKIPELYKHHFLEILEVTTWYSHRLQGTKFAYLFIIAI